MDMMARRPGRVTVLAVGGTGESYEGDRRAQVTGLLAGVIEGLDDRFAARWVGYPASYGPVPNSGGMSYRHSVDAGTANLLATIDGLSGPVVLIGYSQGAVVVRHAVHRMTSAGAPGLSRVLAVGLVADPHQPPGVVRGCTGWGVAGPGLPMPQTLPVCWVGTADDMICNAGVDSFFRDIADLTGDIDLRSPSSGVREIWKMLRRNTLQNARRTSVRPSQMRRDLLRAGSAWREARGYLPVLFRWQGMVVRNQLGGRHTSYAAEPYRRSYTDPDSTGCQWLAAWLQVQLTFADDFARGAARPSTKGPVLDGPSPLLT